MAGMQVSVDRDGVLTISGERKVEVRTATNKTLLKQLCTNALVPWYRKKALVLQRFQVTC